MNRLLVACLMFSVCLVALASSCSDQVDIDCRNIPTGGCRGSDSTNCEDPTCREIYACQANGSWTPVVACPARPDSGMDAGAPHDASSDARETLEVSVRDVRIDVPPGAGGGEGCIDLEMPDCPLEVALACSDCCGCEDLWVCSDGGWEQWGECSEAGVPTPIPGMP
jgi:hypothetical protein